MTVAPGIDYAIVKRENLRRTLEALSRKRQDASVTHKPLLLHLEITSRCNLRCLKCGHATDPPGTPRIMPRNLPYPVIETFDDYFAAAVRVHTFGYGEMFLFNRLKKLVERLKHHGCMVDGITNGVLVDQEEVDWLVEYGYDELTFSIDGVEPATMQRLRGVDIEKLWRTLAYLKQRKQETGRDRPRVVVNFVAQSDNYHELPGLVRKLSTLDIHFLGVNPLMPVELPEIPEDDAYMAMYRQFGLENVERPKLEAALSIAQRLAHAVKLNYCAYIDLDALYARRYASQSISSSLIQILPQADVDKVQTARKLQPYYCSYPWTSVYVHADSGAKVCCFMDGSLGQVENAADMHKVWTEGPITEIREAISKGEVHPACQACVQLGRYQHSAVDLRDIEQSLK